MGNPHNEEGHQHNPGTSREKSPERNAEEAGRGDDNDETTTKPGQPGTAEKD